MSLSWSTVLITLATLSSVHPIRIPLPWKDSSGKYLGIAIDSSAIRYHHSLPLEMRPKKIFLMVFSSRDISSAKVLDDWYEVFSMLQRDYLENPENEGYAMHAVSEMAMSLPPNSTLVLMTNRAPNDLYHTQTAISNVKARNIKLKVIWVGFSHTGLNFFVELINETEAELINKSQAELGDGKPQDSLRQVTLVMRVNLEGSEEIPINIDSSLKKLVITIRGDEDYAYLISPDGKKRDLNEDYTEATGNSLIMVVDLKGLPRGKWILKTQGALYDVKVEGLSKVAIWAQDATKKVIEDRELVEVMVEGNGVKNVEEVELMDRGGNKLASLDHKDDVEESRLNLIVEMDSQQDNPPHFLQIRATDSNGEHFTRLARLPEPRLPTSIEVGLGSQLTAGLGQRAIIYFEVTNNRQIPLMYEFLVTDEHKYIRFVHPTRSVIGGKSTEQVKVELLTPPVGEEIGQSDVLTLTAQLPSGEVVVKKTYFKIGQNDYDNSNPSIWYSYNGDCSNTLSPDNCFLNSWGANVSVQDTGSGLLKVLTKPVALQLSNEFIAGTTNPVNGQFSLTCCHTKVEITAIDVLGNKYSRIIDIEKKWLTAGEISSIVLGSILLLIILIAVITYIIIYCRKRHRTLSLYPEH